jgi:hypothetical protein
MARIHDNYGNLIGGLTAADSATSPFQTSSAPAYARLNPRFGAEETIPGLACSYGAFAYSYARMPDSSSQGRSRLPGCHNPVEDPDERHHCEFCGGDYCSIHAEPSGHDCSHVILPG